MQIVFAIRGCGVKGSAGEETTHRRNKPRGRRVYELSSISYELLKNFSNVRTKKTKEVQSYLISHKLITKMHYKFHSLDLELYDLVKN